MDLEHLNKSQIVLLTLLVSFVTSIATGIVTVSLMEQAPQAITQTVNRVVERTIEKVAPSQTAAAVATLPPQQVIVRESELFSRAITRLSPSVVRLFAPGRDESGNTMQLFVGMAIVSDASGVLIADAGTPDGTLTALRTDGVEVPVSVIARPEGANMIRLQAATTSGDAKETLEWKPAAFSDKDSALGVAVVAIAGHTSTRVAQGIITGTSPSVKDTQPLYVETDIPTDSFAAGSPLIDAEGNIIAIATRESRNLTTSSFLASSQIILQNKDTEEGGGITTAP